MATHNQPAKIGKYEILATLGRGGMGVVYKARDPIIDRIVAVKTILVGVDAADDDGLIDRLHMEARSAGRLHHPNIVTVFDFGEQDDVSYIVMEYVEGVNLARLIDERRPLPLDTKISTLIQIADGLAYAHENGVVHRDMKPSNVCITSRGTAKILDFGLARFDNTRLTKTGYMAGTISYMSPERLSGETGPKDDIFALGAIAYELLTYQRAFAGTMAPEVISKIISPTPPPKPSDVAGLPAELDSIVQKAMAKDIEQRYETAALLADDLRGFMQSDSLREHLGVSEQPTVSRELFANRSMANPYAGSSGKSAAGAPPATMRVQAPTVIQGATEAATVIVPDANTSGPRTQPEMGMTSAQPTQIVATRPPRRAFAISAGIAAVVIAVGAYFLVMRKPQTAPKKVIATQAPKPAPPSDQRNPLADTSELQLETARTLSDELGRRTLTGGEMLKFTQAKARIALAERKLHDKDYESGSHLIGDAITDLQTVMAMSDKRLQTRVTKPVPVPIVQKPETPPPRPTSAPVEPQPQPQPAPVPAPAPQPRPVVEAPEKQITAFMRQLAAAYQSKDVAFFRDHALHFNDQLASAIRNSPSVRVELQIERIDVRDPQHATVLVKRTDWFPDNGLPPAVQSLVYNVEQTAGGWQLASISRR